MKETLLTFEDTLRPCEPMGRKTRRVIARLGGVRRVQMLAHGIIGKKLPETARLRAGVAERPHRLLIVELE